MSTDPLYDDAPKERRQRACDGCRRMKRRCDGQDRCAQCVKLNISCTYVNPAEVRKVASFYDDYSEEYVETLKTRISAAEAALSNLVPQAAIRPWIYARAMGSVQALAKPVPVPHLDDSEFVDIADSFKALSLNSSTVRDPGFQGKSSTGGMVKVIVNAKANKSVASSTESRGTIGHVSPKDWSLKPWENYSEISLSKNFSFPAQHLLMHLTDLYFLNFNSILPILHRPAFNHNLDIDLHRQNSAFGALVLLVCALGCLYLDDAAARRRALSWTFYDQVELCGQSLRRLPTLDDIQAYCLAAQFLHYTSNTRHAWLHAGFGLRLGQDIGLHRDKFNSQEVSLTEDLERRVWWALLFLDSQFSIALGRSPAHDLIECDLRLPHECDDEDYPPTGSGVQPTNQPSAIAFFNTLMNLYRILHYTHSSLYTTVVNHMRVARLGILDAMGKELDSTLDKWFSNIPAHLLWQPDRQDALFFDQSAVLYCIYYYARILIHRTFIPGLPAQSMMPSNPNALDICTKAARACIEVAHIHQKRTSKPLLFSQYPIFTSAIILLLNKWSDAETITISQADETNISLAISLFKSQLEFWPSSEFFLTVLERLVVKAQQSEREADSRSTVPNAMPWEPPAAFNAPSPGFAFPPIFVGDEEILPSNVRRPLRRV
ncbi:Zn(2)-C6 fungal-type domain-containing protein [Favolaschia claudopus]|uniref:Zn(2)-C6 fungal-type domain-containing protein n=1 Tax=Favolaschia claudopus TaxID=2862362 RepID=A0AAW0AF68_9AGAR